MLVFFFPSNSKLYIYFTNNISISEAFVLPFFFFFLEYCNSLSLVGFTMALFERDVHLNLVFI